ncbi:MAG: SH3 domain-containing protein [Sarcina sp.]
MSKNKLIAIITCGTLFIGSISASAIITDNTNTNIKEINNQILLSAPTSNNQGVVINTNQSPLVLYTQPNTNSSVADYLSIGEMLTYQTTSNPNFYKVTVQETGDTGYISSNNIQIISSGVNQGFNPLSEQGQVINVTSNVRLRSQPDMQGSVLATYKNNTNINILGKQGQWYKVNIDGQIGYLYQEYIGIATNKSNITNTTKTSTNITKNSDVNANNSNSSTSTNITPNTTNTTPNSTNNLGTITYNVPNNYLLNTVLITNTTGKAITSSKLNQFLRSWILNGQYNNSTISSTMGTQWASPWLNKISNQSLMQAFINANGEKALSQNITANEFVKATQNLNTMTINNVPFTLTEAKQLILNMLKQNGYANPSDVTRIVFVPGKPAVYQVYTKNSGNNVFWTVAANTGNAQG